MCGKTFRASGILAMAVLGFIALDTQSADKTEPKLLRDILTKVASQNGADCRCARQEADSELAGLSEELVEIAAREKVNYDYILPMDGESKFCAMQLLGSVRAEKAVDILLDNLFYGLYPDAKNAESPFYGSPPPPAVDALVKIGKPSVKAIFQRLRKPFNKHIELVLPESMNKHGGLSEEKRKRIFEDELPAIYGCIIDEVYDRGIGVLVVQREIERASKVGEDETYLENLKKVYCKCWPWEEYSEKNFAQQPWGPRK